MVETTIVTGYYGSGKTEFCVNLALTHRKTTDEKIYIADLDVVNPYFRSREKMGYLRQFNIEILGNTLPQVSGSDIPALNFGFLTSIERGERVILDLAGGRAGIKILAGLKERLRSWEFLCVLNLFRPETSSVEKMTQFIEEINSVGKLEVTGLVNNSHMLHETQSLHVLSGQEAILPVSDKLGIPLRYTLVKQSIFEQIKDEIKSDSVLPFERLQMRENWQ